MIEKGPNPFDRSDHVEPGQANRLAGTLMHKHCNGYAPSVPHASFRASCSSRISCTVNGMMTRCSRRKKAGVRAG